MSSGYFLRWAGASDDSATTSASASALDKAVLRLRIMVTSLAVEAMVPRRRCNCKAGPSRRTALSIAAAGLAAGLDHGLDEGRLHRADLGDDGFHLPAGHRIDGELHLSGFRQECRVFQRG